MLFVLVYSGILQCCITCCDYAE